MNLIISTCIFLHTIFSRTLDLDCLVIFGDSLSDNGNLSKLTLGQIPGKRYWNGRYSNGPVWSEYFANSNNVKHTENWAYSGATTDNKLTSVMPFIPSLEIQLKWFKLKSNSCYNNRSKKHLVSYVAGINNYLDSKITPEQTISDIERQLMFLINELNFTNILVTDLPPMNEAPLFTGSFIKPGETSKYWRNDPNIESKVKKHNLLMGELVNWINNLYPQVNLYFFKISKIWKTAKSLNPYNSTSWNTINPCFDDTKYNEICLKPENYFFFDTAHPITKVHEYIANNISNYLVNNWK